MNTTTMARHAENKTLLNVTHGTITTNSDLKSTMDQYLYYCQHVTEHAEGTLIYYELYLRQFREYMESAGLNNLGEITNLDVDVFFIECRDRLEASSCNLVKAVIKSYISWCKTYVKVELKVISSEIRSAKVRSKHGNALTHAQIRSVIKKARHKQDKLMISLMYESGLRISETIAVKMEHIRGRTIDVVGKGGKHRITFITASLAKQIKDWMNENGWRGGYIFRPLSRFNATTMDQYSDEDALRQRIKKLFKRFVAVDMTPHMLRVAFALRLLRMGCNLRTIQKLLGHSKIETTMTYLKISDDYLEKDHKKFFGNSVYA